MNDMSFLRIMTLLQLVTILAFGQAASSDKAPGLPEQPEAVVRGLYREVTARHPVGIPRDADMKAVAPYLSKNLLHTIDLARACEGDYYRQHENPKDKPQIEWLEFGLFTGGNERVSPSTFDIEKIQSEKDGSFRVHVRLTWGSASKPWIWHVVAVVVQEDGRFVINDIVLLPDENLDDVESRLSVILASGCDGPHWVGYGGKKGDAK
ncbi:MAG TPA: hypothetical protein VN862_11425 [Candidatus Acidoferrales bacterium]|nr:hypothetical protein [Candidatus Acidoferrales bacterium]